MTALVLLLNLPAPSRAWLVAPELGYGLGITMTPAGDVLSCGTSIGADAYDFSVRLQSAVDGTELWNYRLDGSNSGFPGGGDSAAKVAVDGAGNIIAAGHVSNLVTNEDVQVVKLAPDGTPLWTRQIDSASHEDDRLDDMAVGPAGDVAVTGTFSITFGVDHLFSVVRLDGATGVPLWQHDVPAPARSRGATVGFDGAGNVLASGDFITAQTERDVVAVKLDGTTGDELWRTILDNGDGFYGDDAKVATIDAAGDFYVGIRATVATERQGFTVYKLSGSNGDVLWRHDYVTRDDGEATVLALDGAGHLYAGGYFFDFFTRQRFVLEKLSTASGMPIWTRSYPDTFFTSSAFDPAGDLILGGTNRLGLFTIQKVRENDGRKRWQRKLRGNLYNGGFAMGVTTDAIGDVYAIGGDVVTLPKPALDNGPVSYTVLKTCGRDGRFAHTDKCR